MAAMAPVESEDEEEDGEEVGLEVAEGVEVLVVREPVAVDLVPVL